jgi:nucleotide-binding universal stress UspA family protein
MHSNVLIGVDHHDGGRDAVALARQWFARGAELTIAHISTDDPHLYRGASAEYASSERELGLVRLEAARDEAGLQAGIRWCGAFSVARGLHELCAEIGADLLVIGSSRRGRLGRVLLGDDAREALDGAPCSVAIAPVGYRDESHRTREVGVGYDASQESRDALRVGRHLATAHHLKLTTLEVVHTPREGLEGRLAPDHARIDDAVITDHERAAGIGEIEARALHGNPVEELTRFSATVDLLVIGAHHHASIRRSMAGRLAREAHCPLLVVAGRADLEGPRA